MKGVVASFNQEKALVGAFSVITNLRMELFEARVHGGGAGGRARGAAGLHGAAGSGRGARQALGPPPRRPRHLHTPGTGRQGTDV